MRNKTLTTPRPIEKSNEATPATHVSGALETGEPEENLAAATAKAFAQNNREIWDSPEEDAAWAAWQ